MFFWDLFSRAILAPKKNQSLSSHRAMFIIIDRGKDTPLLGVSTCLNPLVMTNVAIENGHL